MIVHIDLEEQETRELEQFEQQAMEFLELNPLSEATLEYALTLDGTYSKEQFIDGVVPEHPDVQQLLMGERSEVDFGFMRGKIVKYGQTNFDGELSAFGIQLHCRE